MPKLEPIPNAPGRASGRRARAMRVSSSLAEINVVPLVDVMLVLLVIFMVAAPMMQQGFPVRLPESRQSRAITAPVTVTVPLTFRRDRRVEIDGEGVSFEFLPERIRQALDARSEKGVILSGDGGITMDDLIAVFDRLKQGGVENVSMQTQPAMGRSR
jgi:biopolymer transport protein TolR